jgi:RNA polymerase sigma factor (sigma-70 family)
MAEAGDSDEALMARYARGDVSAFDLLYQRHELRVWRYLYRSVCNHATADELLQEVWFAVIRSAGGYAASARFTTWLFTLAHHQLIDRHRRSKGQHSSDAIEELSADPRDEPCRLAEMGQHADALIAAVEQLPDEQRHAFLLHAEGEI